MKYAAWIRPEVASLPVYEPGKPVELVAREQGRDPASIIKLASNENPLGAPPAAVEAVRRAAGGLASYPENSAFALVEALAGRLAVGTDQLVVSAGSNELFYNLANLFAGPGLEVVVGEYAFISYRIAASLAGATVVPVSMPGLVHDLDAMRDAVTERTRLVFLPNPNNPTGTALPAAEVAAFARSLPEWVMFCYDEAYVEYEEDRLEVASLIAEGIRIIGTRTFSKIFGLAGLRIGYGYADAELAALLNRVRSPFNTGSVAQAAARAALTEANWEEDCRRANAAGRVQLREGLEAMGLETFGEHGNFVLIRVSGAGQLAAALQSAGVIVRPLVGYGLPEHLRITIGTPEQNQRLLDALRVVRN